MHSMFDTLYGRAIQLRQNATRAVPYILKNISRIRFSDEYVKTLASLRSSVNTPIVDLFRLIATEEALDQYLIMDLSGVTQDLPTVLTYDELSIDGSAIDGVTDTVTKLWTNLTPVLSSRGMSGQLAIGDIPRTMGYFVRGMLCMGYADKDQWLRPAMTPFIIESYSMAVRMRLAKMYDLTPEAAMLVQTAFAYHYAKLLGPSNDATIPLLMNRCGFLGSYTDILDRLEIMTEANGGDLYDQGLPSLCSAVAKSGPPRMQSFDVNVLIKAFAIGNIDTMSLFFAVDYPPYWVYLLLKQAGGGKNVLTSMLFRLGFIKRNAPTFIKAFTTQRDFVHKR